MKSHTEFKKYEDCCAEIGITADLLPIVNHLPEEFRRSSIGDFKCKVITKAINQGWVPDFTDYNQWKYSVCTGIKADKKHPTGFGFSRSGSAGWRAYADCGSRHLFESSEKALYALEQFPQEFKDYILY